MANPISKIHFFIKLFPLRPLHRRAFHLAVVIALLDVVAFVERLFAFAHADGDFHFSVLPEKRQRKQRVALDGCEFKQFPDFRFVQKQFSRRLGFVILDVAVRIFVNVRVVEPRFVFLDAREGVGNLPLARAQRLDLCAMQHDARLKGLEDVVIAPGFVVGDDVSHFKTS